MLLAGISFQVGTQISHNKHEPEPPAECSSSVRHTRALRAFFLNSDSDIAVWYGERPPGLSFTRGPVPLLMRIIRNV